VYPLPPLAAAAAAPLARLDGARVYSWTEGRLRPLPIPSVSSVLVPAGPDDGASASVVVPSERGHLVQLIVLAAGNWSVAEARAAAGGSTSLTFPREFVRAMSRLYPRREILWWTVTQQAGRVVATSEVRRLVASSEKVAVALGVMEPPAKVLRGVPAEGHGHQ
jgi:hypothetical protein